MTHPTDDSLKPCPFCGSQPEPAPYVLKCVNAYCEAQPSVSGGNDDECATAWNKRALLAEQARTEPHKAEDAPSDAELLDSRGNIRSDLKSSAYCVGNEYKPFHPRASHVRPEWRDGWNACFVAAIAQERKA